VRHVICACAPIVRRSGCAATRMVERDSGTGRDESLLRVAKRDCHNEFLSCGQLQFASKSNISI
jgi:hypothetical protein